MTYGRPGENDFDRTTRVLSTDGRETRSNRRRKTGNYCSNKHVSLISETPIRPPRHAAVGLALIKSSWRAADPSNRSSHRAGEISLISDGFRRPAAASARVVLDDRSHHPRAPAHSTASARVHPAVAAATTTPGRTCDVSLPLDEHARVFVLRPDTLLSEVSTE